MAKERFIGGEMSLLGTNPNPMISDGAAPPVPVKTNQADGEIPRLVSLMAKNDGIEATQVSAGSEIRKGRTQESVSGMNFINGDSMQPAPPPPHLHVLPDVKKNAEEIQTPSPKRSRSVKKSTPGSMLPEGQQQSANFETELDEKFVESEVARRIEERFSPTFEVEYRSGYLTIFVPVVSISVSGAVVMIHTPISNKTRLEPPRGEEIIMKVPQDVEEPTGLLNGVEHQLYCTGIYSDIPKFGVRCSVFFIKPGE